MWLVTTQKPVLWLSSDHSKPLHNFLPHTAPKALMLFGLSQTQRSRECRAVPSDPNHSVILWLTGCSKPSTFYTLSKSTATKENQSAWSKLLKVWRDSMNLQRCVGEKLSAICPPRSLQLSCQHTWLVKIQQEHHQHFAPQGLVSSECRLRCEFFGPVLKGYKWTENLSALRANPAHLIVLVLQQISVCSWQNTGCKFVCVFSGEIKSFCVKETSLVHRLEQRAKRNIFCLRFELNHWQDITAFWALELRSNTNL